MRTNESVSVTKIESDRPVPPGSIVRLVNADEFTPLWKGALPPILKPLTGIS